MMVAIMVVFLKVMSGGTVANIATGANIIVSANNSADNRENHWRMR